MYRIARLIVPYLSYKEALTYLCDVHAKDDNSDNYSSLYFCTGELRMAKAVYFKSFATDGTESSRPKDFLPIIPPAYEVCHGGIMFSSFLCVCVCVCVC